MYHVERTFRETGEAFNDGSHIIYVNGSYKNEATPVGKLMHDFRCTSSDDMFFSSANSFAFSSANSFAFSSANSFA